MNQEIKSIGIYPENCQFESNYLPLISFKTEQQKTSAEKYILIKVDRFFKQIIDIDIDVINSQINYSKLITEKDFSEKPIKYFYENIFDDIGQRNARGELYFSPKWGITFDEKCAPIQVSMLPRGYLKKYNGDSYYPSFKPFNSKYRQWTWNYKYGTIDINGKPIFYYIHFTLQELLDVIR
jgi:hypothetical protein